MHAMKWTAPLAGTARHCFQATPPCRGSPIVRMHPVNRYRSFDITGQRLNKNATWAKTLGSTGHQQHPTRAQAVPDRSELCKLQAGVFNRPEVVKQFTADLPDSIQKRLTSIANSVPGLNATSRVIDVGSGTGALIPALQLRGAQDILAVDLSSAMLQELRARYSKVGTLGNDLGVRTWEGDFMDMPTFMGQNSDAFFFNAVFGNLHSPRDALLKAALLLKPGGHIVVSHPMGRAWHQQLHQEEHALVPHQLPDRAALDNMLWDLPLRVVDFEDSSDMYLAVLQVPPRYVFPSAPVRLGGKVVSGFGRGSRQMGTPTANIDPEPLKAQLQQLPRGVYFGWARLDAPSSWPEGDRKVHKMVMNVGRRPTVNSGDDVTVEVHILHQYAGDFYGENLEVVALGYIRPEMRFTGGLPELIRRIKADIAIARLQLDDPEAASHASSLA